MPRRDLLEGRRLRAALLGRVGQRGWKWQPGGGLEGSATSPSRSSRSPRNRGSGLGTAARSASGVGMHGRGEERFGRRQLDDAAHIHHGHAVTHQPHHRQVMSHEEIGEPELGLEVLHQVEDLGLHRDVEGGHGLVGHHEARIEGEGARDAHALALPPLKAWG